MNPLVSLNRERLLQQLHSQQLKRYWLAECAGIHKSTLRRWLSGDIRQVRAETLTRVAGLLEVAPEALIAPSGAPEAG
jgi:transcriptional regulator with XRE-family HTH domain